MMKTHGAHPYFTDAAKQAKLEEAIRLGLIAVSRTEYDDLFIYHLTMKGAYQWSTEHMSENQ